MTDFSSYRLILKKVKEKALACGRNPEEIMLIAVTKNCSVETIQKIYQEGAREFGESRVVEALNKIRLLPSDCCWHLIGTLQSNKIVKAISYFHLIHSVDTPQLARKISQVSKAKGIITRILLQVNTSGEVTKHGLSGEEWKKNLEEIGRLSHLRIEGLMTIAPYTEDQQIIRSCFQKLYQLREEWREGMQDPTSFRHLSMGMSHDYQIAIEEGATLLRIGTAIFG